ncbi:unnamed protein product [Pipistrellus nathusii]|uniref:Uncharacterized protein n=1 Tax=Pipistrellus nathusii TaxID=59473 RepID=A0ABP0ACD5_PIPNA
MTITLQDKYYTGVVGQGCSFCLGTSLTLTFRPCLGCSVWRAWAFRRTCNPLRSRTSSLWNQKAHPPHRRLSQLSPKDVLLLGLPVSPPGQEPGHQPAGGQRTARRSTALTSDGASRLMGLTGKVTKLAGGNAHGRGAEGRGERKSTCGSPSACLGPLPAAAHPHSISTPSHARDPLWSGPVGCETTSQG